MYMACTGRGCGCTHCSIDGSQNDGAMDVVAGYSTNSGGALALFRGNPDAYAPRDHSLYKKAVGGTIAPTFLPRASTSEQ